MKPISEAQFVQWSRGLQASDQAAASDLFRATYPYLFRYAYRFTHDVHLAEDAVQDAFVRIWKRRTTIDPEGSLRTLLYVTVRNLTLNLRRDTARRQTMMKTMDPDTASPPMPDDQVQVQLLRRNLRRWIDELPARRREAFQLSRYDGLSYREIAGVMDLSVKSVETHIRLALNDLRAHLRDFDPDLLQP